MALKRREAQPRCWRDVSAWLVFVDVDSVVGGTAVVAVGIALVGTGAEGVAAAELDCWVDRGF